MVDRIKQAAEATRTRGSHSTSSVTIGLDPETHATAAHGYLIHLATRETSHYASPAHGGPNAAMVDTLKIAEDLELGADGFTTTQARRLAAAIAQASDDRRLKDLEVKVGIQTVLSTVVLAAVLVVFWQFDTLRGELSGVPAQATTRLLTIEHRMTVGAVE